MLPTCRIRTSAPRPTAIINRGQSTENVQPGRAMTAAVSMIGNTTAATIEANETYRQMLSLIHI